jgi:hypothetical protein
MQINFQFGIHRKMEILKYIFLEAVGGQHLRVANDLAAQSGGLDLFPQCISLGLERAVSALGVAARVGNSLADAGTTSATTTGTNCSTKASKTKINMILVVSDQLNT